MSNKNVEKMIDDTFPSCLKGNDSIHVVIESKIWDPNLQTYNEQIWTKHTDKYMYYQANHPSFFNGWILKEYIYLDAYLEEISTDKWTDVKRIDIVRSIWISASISQS